MKLFMSDEIDDATSCPNCHGDLESEHHAYMIAIREGREERYLTVGCNAGSFCQSCPTVVLDQAVIEDLISIDAKGTSLKYAVMGMVDLDAVPEEKKDIPFGGDDNPIPLIKFERPNLSRKQIGSSNRAISFPAQSPQPKVGRNAPCPCESGKKFKKCCGR